MPEDNVPTLYRAMTKDGSCRLLFAVTTGIVQKAHEIHGTSKTTTALLGRSLTAASLMGALCKDDDERVTLQIKGDGPAGPVLCEASLHGTEVRGYVTEPGAELPPNSHGKLDVGGAVGAGTLTVIRDAPGWEGHSGTIELCSGEVAEDVARYFAVSEQTPTVCALGVRVAPDCSCVAAGGFLLQMLPGDFRDRVEQLEANITGLPSISAFVRDGGTVETLAAKIFAGMEYEIFESKTVQWACHCGKERYAKALSSLDADELEDMIEEGKPVETRCRWCRSGYTFSVEEIADLLREKRVH